MDRSVGGLYAADTFDDGQNRAFEVLFEENDDGRLRSRLMSYEAQTDGNGTSLIGWQNYVDDHGQLIDVPVSYLGRGADAPPAFEHGGIRASNSFDPGTTWPVSDPAFPE